MKVLFGLAFLAAILVPFLFLNPVTYFIIWIVAWVIAAYIIDGILND